MVALVIFWSAVFALIFFVVGIVFKYLAAAMNALLNSVVQVLAAGGFVLLVGFVLYFIFAIIGTIVEEGFWEGFLFIILTVFSIALCIGLCISLGGWMFELAYGIFCTIFGCVSAVLEWIAAKCEGGYYFFMKAIISRIDKC